MQATDGDQEPRGGSTAERGEGPSEWLRDRDGPHAKLEGGRKGETIAADNSSNGDSIDGTPHRRFCWCGD
jgi:hypothetical protein